MDTLRFPQGFLWGTATSSHQVEGGNENSDWSAWEQEPGRIRGGGRAGRACGWWEGRAEEDFDRAAGAGLNSQRLSLEWSRLEPEPGRWDGAAFDRYRRMLDHLHRRGLTPMVTVYHFTLPLWQSRRGGWLDPDIVGRFRDYAAECARRLGDGVPLWCTINEPFSLMYHGYFRKSWPPGGKSIPETMRAAGHLFQAHAAAYAAVKQERPGASVGLVHIMQDFRPATGSPLDRLAARAQEWSSVDAWLRPMRTGRLAPPWGAGKRIAGLAGAADFYGVNYYGSYRVRFDPRSPTLGSWVTDRNITSGDQDWGEPHPAGLARGLLKAAALGKPVYVTENGIFDPADSRRPDYLLRHLEAVHQALAAGADVRGYYHWSLLDNFEWGEGWTTPFGLIAMDPATLERRPRGSFALYSEIARSGTLTLPRSP